jgi:transposase
VVYLETRKVRGRTYWYLVEKQRQGKRLVKTINLYLGTPASLLERLQGKATLPTGDLHLRSYPFGRAAALLSVARDLDLQRLVDHYGGKRKEPGFTIGQYLLLSILARAYEPWSKAATGRWFYRDSFLRFLWKAPHKVNSANILSNLRHLADGAVQNRIEFAVAQKLVARGMRPSRLFWDVTNHSTYLEEGEDLPQPGHAKDRRYDLNLVSTGLVVTEDHVPLFHETLPGNCDEYEVFEQAVEALTVRLTRLELDPAEMVMVMDKGANSDENLAKAADLMHVVGSAPSHLVPDLMDLSLEEYTPIHATMRGHRLLGYLTRRDLYGQSWNVAVIYNNATAARKEEAYRKYEARFVTGIQKIKEGYERARGRPLSYARAQALAAALVFPAYQSAFRYTISETPRRLSWEVNPEARDRMHRRFGKRVFFTDLDMDAETMVRTYDERWKVEEDFRWMKGEEMMPFSPLFVRKDDSIVTHAFLVVLGLMLWRMAFQKIRQAGVKAKDGEIFEALDELKIALVGETQGGRLKAGRWVLEDHSPLAERLYRALELEKLVPGSS